MKKYVWAYINFYDNEIVMGHDEFNSEMDACKFVLEKQGISIEDESFEDIEDLKQFAFDCDCMVGAYCVS